MIKSGSLALQSNLFCIPTTVPACQDTAVARRFVNLFVSTCTGHRLQWTAIQLFRDAQPARKIAFNYIYMRDHYNFFSASAPLESVAIDYSES